MNTGKKIYRYLKQINASTGVPTGVVKENLLTDPNYVAPIVDYTLCPIVTWQPLNPFCLVHNTCASGYVLSSDGATCQRTETVPATPPTGSGGTAGIALKINDAQWNNGGARLYDPGYGADGNGSATSLLTPHFWVNGAAPFDTATRNTVDGRMNVAGIWGSGVPNYEFIGFSRKITTTIAKTVYVGISADNQFKFTLNGALVVSSNNILGYPNFRYWNIYPVQLLKGINYIEVYAENFEGSAGFAAEIYDNTQAQILAAATETDLNIIFSTKNIVGQYFDLGETFGYSCPAGYSLANDGAAYYCTRTVSQAPIVLNTGQKGFANRARVITGVPDGYQESNANGAGLGPYFAPATDTVTCPT